MARRFACRKTSVSGPDRRLLLRRGYGGKQPLGSGIWQYQPMRAFGWRYPSLEAGVQILDEFVVDVRELRSPCQADLAGEKERLECRRLCCAGKVQVLHLV